jgi:membrane-associated phospholipid phosphatase
MTTNGPTIELEIDSSTPVNTGFFRQLAKGITAIGPDLLLTLIMSLILATALLASGGQVRFLQATLGFPIGIVLFLIIYRSIAKRFRPGMQTNVGHILRDWLPFLLVTFIYENLHDLSKYFMNIDIAGTLMQWDIAIFGVEPTLWAQKIYSPLLTDIMAFSYALYFVQPLIIMFLLSNQDNRVEFRKMALTLTFTFLLGFVGYVLLPCSPPRYFITDMFTDPVRLHGPWLFDRLQAQWDSLSVVPCGAFPSLHVGLSTVALIYAWRFRNISTTFRVIWWLYIPLVTSLWFSTVYLRHHWVIDIFAGWGAAIVSAIASDYILGHWNRWHKSYE